MRRAIAIQLRKLADRIDGHSTVSGDALVAMCAYYARRYEQINDSGAGSRKAQADPPSAVTPGSPLNARASISAIPLADAAPSAARAPSNVVSVRAYVRRSRKMPDPPEAA